jgi:hypothetical protein
MVERPKVEMSVNTKEGDVVFIGSDGTKRLEWSMVRVLKIYPGQDRFARVVRLRTSDGEVTQSMQHLLSYEGAQKGGTNKN